MPLRRGLQAPYEFSRINLQGLREQEDVVKRHVALATFDATDVVAVEAGRFTERLLRIPMFGA